MGNCQAAEAEAVVILRPGNKIQRIYSSVVTARHVMSSNPGHYVAVVVTLFENGLPVKKLKLLRPDDSLLVGKVYLLICFDGKQSQDSLELNLFKMQLFFKESH